MLVATDLRDKLIAKIDTEVKRCNGDYSSFDRGIYLQEIYDYIKDNAKITVTYTGVTPTGPDPSSGIHRITPQIVSNDGLKQGVLSAQSSVNSFPPNEWWQKLINSIQITLNFSDESSIITFSSPVIIIPITTKSWSTSDFSNSNDYKQNWLVWCNEIITAIKSITVGQVSPSLIPTTSKTGGTGNSVFTSIS